MPSFLRKTGIAAFLLLLGLITLWTFGTIHYDGPFPGWINTLLALLWLGLLVFLLFRIPHRRFPVWLGFFLAVFIPWLFKRPSHHRDWAPEFARVPTATIEGDLVTIHNFRHFDYEANGIPVQRWETRSFHLSNLRAMDFFMTYWGSELVGHPIFSFDFGPEGHVAFSIEARREKGETYGVLSGLYKQFELVYIAGAESDLIRLRTNFRPGEDVWLYRLQLAPDTPRSRFLEYIHSMRDASDKPRFYNSVTANCTTAVRAQLTNADRHALDWRIIANGKLDELFRDRNLLLDSPPFAELKKQSHINSAALANPYPGHFSHTIRKNLPGF